MEGEKYKPGDNLCDKKILFLCVLCSTVIIAGATFISVSIVCTDSLGLSFKNGSLSCADKVTDTEREFTRFSPSYSSIDSKPRPVSPKYRAKTANTVMKTVSMCVIVLIIVIITIVATIATIQRRKETAEHKRNSNLAANLKAAFDESVNNTDDKSKLLGFDQQKV